MVRPIMRDMLFLSQPSAPAAPADAPVIADLKDTLRAHADACVGMAANMIGVHRRIIIVAMGPTALVLMNPVIVEKRGVYDAEEGCLSLSGTRRTKRFRDIEVTYQDEGFRPRRQAFSGFVAQIIQHEVDHCDGRLI